ncbi:MAG: hypothetical protein K940chlam9_01111 [Chlamydiae bacterium]|nr:hypothetical protein [Chlamydiota bacterium]
MYNDNYLCRHTELVQNLLERIQNPIFKNRKNKDGKTALDLAQENEHQEIVALLYESEDSN